MNEQCLSIPDLPMPVTRPDRVALKWLNVDGTPSVATFDGILGPCIQHEFDHLNGVVFLDRMASPASLAFEKEWERYVLDRGDDL